MRTLISSAVEAGELSESAPVEDLAETVAEALYGQLLCWAIDGGKPGYACRARKFCDTCLEGIFEEYLIAKEGK